MEFSSFLYCLPFEWIFMQNDEKRRKPRRSMRSIF